MTEEQRVTALDLLARQGVYRTIEARDATFGDEGMADFLGRVSGGNSELVRWRKAIENDLNIQPMSRYDGRPIYKIVFMCEKAEQLQPAVEALEKDFHFLVQDVSGANYVNGELINRQFDKGAGVRLVAQALGVDLADTIGFGDSMNDLEMIQAVGTGVCMANGSPTLKRHSDLVCPAVEEDGLAAGFAQLGLI